MEQFESFCEVIATNVEILNLSWHGRNDISSIQAIKLVHNRYMLGGFIISADAFHPLLMVTNAMSMITGIQRIHGNELKRDNEALDFFTDIIKKDTINAKIMNLLRSSKI